MFGISHESPSHYFPAVVQLKNELQLSTADNLGFRRRLVHTDSPPMNTRIQVIIVLALNSKGTNPLLKKILHNHIHRWACKGVIVEGIIGSRVCNVAVFMCVCVCLGVHSRRQRIKKALVREFAMWLCLCVCTVYVCACVYLCSLF